MAEQVIVINPNIPTKVVFDFIGNDTANVSTASQQRTIAIVDVEIQEIKNSIQPSTQALVNAKELTVRSADTLNQLKNQLKELMERIECAELDLGDKIDIEKRAQNELDSLKDKEKKLLDEKRKLREEALKRARDNIAQREKINRVDINNNNANPCGIIIANNVN